MILSFVLLFLNQTLTFQTNQLAQKIKEENFLFIHVPPSYLFYIRSFNPKEAKMENVLIYKGSPPFLLITAREGKWTGDGWIFFQGLEYLLKEKLEGISFDKKFLPLDKNPSYFTKKYFPPEKMNISELKKCIDEYQKGGFETLRNFVLLLLGIPIGLILRKGGRGASFALGLTISFGYYEAMALFKTLGKGGIISPCLAAWIPNFIFLIGGIYLFTRVE